jgi:stearoyl-CoA desaturase (delta-9 desaturase)
VFLQHCTFCINSLCHYIGRRPYSSHCSARDSWIMAIFTFGEGYHNFHHEFQHDYRNGVKPWQFDPTKWIIWTLSKVGLAQKLRTVPSEKILLAELGEAQRRMETKLECPHLTDAARAYIAQSYARLQATAAEWAQFKDAQMEITREMLVELRSEVRAAIESLKTRHHEVADAEPAA